MTLFSLAGKVAVITGSSRGIGKAIAERLAEHGAKVVISSRKLEACEQVAAAINAKHGDGRAIAVAANISSKEALQNLVDETVKRLGPVDALVCNAASNPYYGPLAGISDEQFRKVLDNNIVSNHWLINMVAPGMMQRRNGSIVIVSSIGGLRGSPIIGAYCISKAADMQLARNLAVEFGPHNVRVNCIAPGLIKTDFAKALWDDPKLLEARNAETPLRRIGDPDEIAGAVAFAGAEGIGDGRAQGAGGHLGGDDPVPGLPAPVFMDHEGNAGSFGNADHLQAVVPGGRHRLLADNRDAAPGSDAEHGQVQFGAGGDVQKVRPDFVEHPFEVVKGLGGGLAGFRQVGVTGGDDGGFRDAAPPFQVDLAEEAAAGDSAAEGRGHLLQVSKLEGAERRGRRPAQTAGRIVREGASASTGGPGRGAGKSPRPVSGRWRRCAWCRRSGPRGGWPSRRGFQCPPHRRSGPGRCSGSWPQ